VGGMLVAALHGSGGTGKTTLAVRWAHEVADHFEDGQLFLNLRGYGPGLPVEPAEALDTLLRGFGVPGDAIPPGVDARSALLRTTLASRRVLIVLDNARSADQVRPLLPGPGAVVLVTSRTQLRGLAARDGARRIQVARLLPTESRTMLGKLLTSQGTPHDEADLVQLAEACVHLPLALAIAAERAGRYPGIPVSESIARLQDAQDRLGAFDSGDDDAASLRAVFAMSYDSLDVAAARMFRLLGVHPGSDVSAAAAAALAGVPLSTAVRLLDVLSDVNMVDQRPGGRYEQHDLLREYAGELTSDAERDEATELLACWYTHSSVNARHVLDQRPILTDLGPVADGVTPLTFADERSALAWYDAEYRSLVAMVESLVTSGHGQTAARIVHSLNVYLISRWYVDEAMELQTTALKASQAVGDVLAEAVSCQQIGGTCFQRGQYAEAEAWIRRAVELFDDIGDEAGRCVSQAALGLALQMSGQLDASIESLEEAFRTADALQLGSVAANARNNLAWGYSDAGRLQDATEAATRSAAYYRMTGEKRGLATALDTLGYILAAQGRHADAVVHLEASVDTHRDLGRFWTEAAGLLRLGDSSAALGQKSRARECWLRALRILDELKAADTSELSRSHLLERLASDVPASPRFID
jgi:tetratricopeptide (TPR) repeat protein